MAAMAYAITTGNMLYALPLVDLGDPKNPTQGTLANKNSLSPMENLRYPQSTMLILLLILIQQAWLGQARSLLMLIINSLI